jgi:quinol-cytochrome oxidoreductase complex cytochrome b subunit
MMALAFLTVMLGLIAYMPAPLEERANPYLSPAGVLPEWYLLPPFELLHLVPPLPGMLGTGAAVMVLMFWPFIDRKPRRISRRPFMMIFSLLIIASLIGLSVYSVLKVAAE